MSISYHISHPSNREPQRRPDLVPPDELQGYSIDGQDIKPGEHVRSVCRKHDISFPNDARKLKGFKLKRNPCKWSVAVSEKHCIQRNSMKYLDKYEHPFAKSVLNMYVSRKQEPLWLSVSSLPVASPFPCSTARKKLKHAFYDALAAHGYDREGRRIATEGNSSIIADLCGTVQLTCGDPKVACRMKFADLLESAMAIVSAVELALGRDKDGIRINPMQQSPKSKKSKSSTHWVSSSSKKMGTRPRVSF